MKLAHHMQEAWSLQAKDALDVLATAAVAPALVKPEAVQEAAQRANGARRHLEAWADAPEAPVSRGAFWSYL